MKITFAILAIAVLGTLTLPAGPQEQVKERAKRLRDQNNERQDVPTAPPPTRPNPPAMTPPAAATPTITHPPAKPTPAARIKTDLIAWQSKKSVDADAKKTFLIDLKAAVRGSRSPSATNLEKLTDSLAGALEGKTLGANQLSRLAQNINLALNSAGLSVERREEVASEVQADLASTGAAQTAAAAAATDLKAVMAGLNE